MSVFISALLILLIAILLLIFYLSKQKSNKRLQAMNLSLQKQNVLIEKAHSIITSDMHKALDYVVSLLPVKIKNDCFSTDWLFYPSSKLGGDSFGYHWLDRENFAIYLLDVCGHGVGPALHSVSVLHVLRSGTLLNVDQRQPEMVLSSLNTSFRMAEHNEMYFTIWYGVYNVKSRLLRYACAGHPAPLLLAETGEEKYLDTPNIFVGCIDDLEFKSDTTEISKNSRLYIFSDGVYEIFKNPDEIMQLDEFYDMLKSSDNHNENELDEIYKRLRLIQKERDFADDFSLMKITFT